MEIRCSRCKELKDESEFYSDKTRPNGHGALCKPCKAAYGHEQYLRYKERRRELRHAKRPTAEQRREKMLATLEREYKADRQRSRRHVGLTRQQVDQMVQDQGGHCAICGCDLLELDPKKVHVDHCHQSGRIRGILCQWCNSVLGFSHDDPTILRAACYYLETK